MDTTKELISKYLAGACTAAEAAEVELYLKSNPQAMDELFPESEWQRIAPLPPLADKDRLYDLVNQRIQQRQRYRRIVKRIGQVAACLALSFGLYSSYQYYHQHTLAVEAPLVQRQVEQAPTVVANMYYINSDNKPMHIQASDGSTITLYPKSEVRFAESFVHTDERIIELKGKAKFEVAKDKSKPFRVISQGLVTSALGTVFLVDELAPNETKVNLLEGSIEIKTLDASRKTIKRVIKPQESLHIDHQHATILGEERVNDSRMNREGYYVQRNQKINIKNLAVEDILLNLEQNFAVELHYDRAALRNKYFSGNFDYSAEVYQRIIEEINYLHKTNITKK